MTASVNPVAPAADMAPLVPVSPAAPIPAPAAVSDQADLRLVIEETGQQGSYVYKTLDRRTGEIVHQFPREQLLRLREATSYEAGTVINAKA